MQEIGCFDAINTYYNLVFEMQLGRLVKFVEISQA